MKNMIIMGWALGICLLSSCKEEKKFKILPEGPIKHQLIVAAKTSTSVKVRGFTGATPPGTKVYFEVGPEHALAISNPDGSFNLELKAADLSATHGEFNFTMPDKKHQVQGYELKNLSESLSLVADKALSAPPEISFVSIHDNQALILSQEAALLRRVKINSDWTLSEDSQENILLNPKTEEKPSPQMVDARKNHAVVSLFNTGKLSLVDLAANKLIDSFKLSDNQTNSAERVMALDDTNYLVSFVNFSYTKKDDSKEDSYDYGPGVLALVEIKNNSINATKVLHLPNCKNPYDFKAENPQELWVSCRGVEVTKNGQKNISDAALVKLSISSDKKDINIKHTKVLGNFVPGEFEIIGDTLIVPELWGNRLLVLKESSVDIKPIEAKYSRKFNYTVATRWHEDIVMLGDADGALIAYSLSEGFFPFPFSEPINITHDKHPQIKFEPSQIIMKSTSSNTSGYAAWVVLHAQNKIIPLDFLRIFGP